MRTQEQIKKEIQDTLNDNTLDYEATAQKVQKLQALLNYSNKIIEEIEKWSNKHWRMTISPERINELKSSIIGNHSQQIKSSILNKGAQDPLDGIANRSSVEQSADIIRKNNNQETKLGGKESLPINNTSNSSPDFIIGRKEKNGKN